MSLHALGVAGIGPPLSSGESGNCTHCGAVMVGKVGSVVVAHWAHRWPTTCDAWSEGESDWHRDWKARFAERGCAIEQTLERHGQRHRADVVLRDGTIVEVQRRHLAHYEAVNREAFYMRMVWLLDGTHLGERWHEGKNLGPGRYGFWIKNGSKSWTQLRRARVVDLGAGEVARLDRIGLVDVDSAGERLVGVATIETYGEFLDRIVH